MIAEACLIAITRVLCSANVRWIGSRPDTTQRVYFANHTSHLDFIVLWSNLPRTVRALTRPVAAADYWDRGGLRGYLATRVFNAVLVDRRGAQSESAEERLAASRRAIERMVEGLGDRHSLILFPEGTRGTGEQVAPFRSGLYHLCQRVPHVELVPAYLVNLNRILPKGEVLPAPLLSRVTFGPTMHLEPDEPKDAFLARARDAVIALAAA